MGVSVADAVGCNKWEYSTVWKLNYPVSNLLIDPILILDLEPIFLVWNSYIFVRLTEFVVWVIGLIDILIYQIVVIGYISYSNLGWRKYESNGTLQS